MRLARTVKYVITAKLVTYVTTSLFGHLSEPPRPQMFKSPRAPIPISKIHQFPRSHFQTGKMV